MNQMKKNYLGLPPLFCPAEIIVVPEVEAAFADWEIACALWRHLHGDWAEPFRRTRGAVANGSGDGLLLFLP